MKRLLLVASLAAAACLAWAPAVLAQDGGDEAAPKRPERVRGQRQRGPRRPGRQAPGAALRRALGQLDLNAEQKKQTDGLLAKFQEEMKAGVAKNAEQRTELFKQLREARQANDEAKINTLREELRKLRPDVTGKMKELQEAIKPILTDEQNENLGKLLARTRGRRLPPAMLGRTMLRNAEKLGLTDEQKGKVKDLLKAFNDAAKGLRQDEGKDRAAKAKAYRELNEKLAADLKGLLTDEQKVLLEKQLEEMRGRRAGGPGGGMLRRFSGLDLTEDQKKQVQDLEKAFRDSLQDAKPEDRRALRRKLMEDVRAVLTPEQQEKLRTERQGWRPRRARPNPAGAE